MKHALLAVLGVTSFVASLTSVSAGASITVNPTAPTTTTGVSFDVTTGGGNRDFASVAVTCSDALGSSCRYTGCSIDGLCGVNSFGPDSVM